MSDYTITVRVQDEPAVAGAELSDVASQARTRIERALTSLG